MTDLSTPQMQATFKRIQRTSAANNAIMAFIAVLSAGLAIWVAVERARLFLTDWSVAVFIVLLCFICIYFTFMVVWGTLIRRPYKKIMHTYVAESYAAAPAILQKSGTADFEIMLIADKIIVMRMGLSDTVQLDLSPISKYPNVCAYVAALTFKFIKDFYCLYAERLNITQVRIKNSVNKKGNVTEILSPAKPLAAKKQSMFVKYGLF